jgi:membrane-associated phospholipid phosphatase
MKRGITIGRLSISWIVILGFVVLVASSLFNFVTSELIQYLYPDRPVVPDLLFDILPYVPAAQYAFDALVAANIIMMLYYAFAVDRKHAGYYLFTVGVGYVARAILMALTPLGQPTGNNETMGIGLLLNIYQHGMFPSGHTYLTAVIFFLIDRRRAPRLKTTTGIFCICEMILLLLSHAHYSIDLVGGLMTAFLTFYLMNRFKERFREPSPDAGSHRRKTARKR